MKCHKCDEELKEDNYYCDECASYLKKYQQKKEEKPKVNQAKEIHDFMFN